MNAGVAKLIPSDLVYSRTAPTSRMSALSRRIKKSTMIAQPNARFGVHKVIATHNAQDGLDEKFQGHPIVPRLRR
jgi:hypothetical protein